MEQETSIGSRGLLEYDVDVPGLGHQLHVMSDPCSHEYEYNIGSGLWQAAIELLKYLSGLPDGLFNAKTVLELGCGLGVVGQALQLRGAMVTLTDREVQLPLLHRNVDANFGADGPNAPKVDVLDWAETPEWAHHSSWDFVIASDVAYDEDCFIPLINCLLQLACPSSLYYDGPKILLALPDRPETLQFFELADKAGVTWRRLRWYSPPDLVTPVSVYQFVLLLSSCPSRTPHHHVSTSEASPSKRSKVVTEGLRQFKTLVVFDFDWSLVEENSDTWVLDELGATHIFKRLKATGMPWTQLMDASLLAAHEELKIGRQDIQKACASIPFAACMRQAVAELAGRGCDLIIVSDANSVYIESILQHHGLGPFFKEVHTNRAVWEGEALRVHPYHQGPEPHSCPKCPPNLCKGRVIERILLQRNYTKVVYLGDGAGDFCPSTRLGPHDSVLSRELYPTGASCSLLRLAKKASARIADCFQGPGRRAVGATADAAALASAADADGCSSARAHGASGGDGSAAHRNGAAGQAAVAITPRQISETGGQRQGSADEVVRGSSPGNTLGSREALQAGADHARGEPCQTASNAAAGDAPKDGSMGAKGSLQAMTSEETGREMKQQQYWLPGPIQIVPQGEMAALVCPWQSPKEAVDLLLLLARVCQ